MANIRTARRSGFIQRGGVRRRETLWADFAFTQTTMTAVGGTILSSLSAAGLALRPFTVVRTHMQVHILSDQSAATELYAAAYGHAIVSEQAVAIGITAVPTPVTDGGSDLWYVYQKLLGAGSQVNSGQSGQGFSIDSRAMRKVEDGSDLINVIEFSAIGSGLIAMVSGRDLLKLH